MTAAGTPDPDREDAFREAAGWFARMRADDAEAHRPAFEAWLAEDAAHRSAYNRAAEIFAMGKLLADDAGTVAPADPRPVRRFATAPALAAVAGLLLVLVAGGWLAVRLAPWSAAPSQDMAGDATTPATEILSAPAGETRQLRLADGSVLRLGGGALVEVAFGASERRLALRRGEVRFTVFHDPRPFVVEAGGGRVTARGTIFDVALSPRRSVHVRLIEGRIDVALPASTPAARPVVRALSPGEALTYLAAVESAAANASRPGAPPPSSPGGEPRAFDNVTLGQLLAEANQANGGERLRLADPALAVRRISGRFRIDDPERLARQLATLLGLALQRDGTGAIVLASR